MRYGWALWALGSVVPLAVGGVAPAGAQDDAPPVEPSPAAVGANYPVRLLSGFGDISFATASKGVRRNFSLGQLTLQYTSSLSPRSFVFTEVTHSPQEAIHNHGYRTEVERLFVRFDQSDSLKISAGRYHTPVNWWNTAFHHGLWLQTTIDRPEMAKFGGKFLPPHFVGLLVEGGVPAGGWNFNYNVGLGNGRSVDITNAGDQGDNNGATARVANVFLRPDRFYGLQVGASAYIDRLTVASRGVREAILAGHLVYQKETPEVLAEYATVRHSSVGQPAVRNHGAYMQVAYRRPGSLFKSYYRLEWMQVSLQDPILTATPSLTGHTVGLRYDFTDLAALKGEYRTVRRRSADPASGVGTSGFFVQVCFAF